MRRAPAPVSALPNLSTDLKASLWASLYHSLAVAGRTDEALAIEDKAKDAAYASTDEAYWLAYELARSGLQYQLLISARRSQLRSKGSAAISKGERIHVCASLVSFTRGYLSHSIDFTRQLT